MPFWYSHWNTLSYLTVRQIILFQAALKKFSQSFKNHSFAEKSYCFVTLKSLCVTFSSNFCHHTYQFHSLHSGNMFTQWGNRIGFVRFISKKFPPKYFEYISPRSAFSDQEIFQVLQQPFPPQPSVVKAGSPFYPGYQERVLLFPVDVPLEGGEPLVGWPRRLVGLLEVKLPSVDWHFSVVQVSVVL